MKTLRSFRWRHYSHSLKNGITALLQQINAVMPEIVDEMDSDSETISKHLQFQCIKLTIVVLEGDENSDDSDSTITISSDEDP